MKNIPGTLRRLSGVESIPSAARRFASVPGVSSAARMPFPSATSARAVIPSSLIVMFNRIEGVRPWTLSFSYGRALQDEALRAWQGRDDHLTAGQQAFYHRAKCDSAAALGRYTTAMEQESVVA